MRRTLQSGEEVTFPVLSGASLFGRHADHVVAPQAIAGPSR